MDRGRDVAGVIQQYTKFVKPAFDTYVAPSRKHADVIVPWARRAAAYGWLSPRALSMKQAQVPEQSLSLVLLRREEPNQVAISLITEHIKMKVGGVRGP